jgi:putative hemolysin
MIAFVLLRVLVILLLVAANAFFAAAEFALVSVRDTRIQQLIESGRIGARIVQRLHQHLDEVVNGVQLGITIVSLTLGWIGEPMVAGLVGSLHFVQRLPHVAIYAHGIAIAIAFSLITYMHVILGELVPKTLALQRAEQIALAVAAPMEAFLTLTRPVLFLCGAPEAWCSALSVPSLPAAEAPSILPTNSSSSLPPAASLDRSPNSRKR